RDTRHVRLTAQIILADERDTAIALTRLLLWRDGPIDDFVNASAHGAPWTPESSQDLLNAFDRGLELQDLARRYGRTQLAIAWRLLDSTARPVKIPNRLMDIRRLERTWANVRERSAEWSTERSRRPGSDGLDAVGEG